MDALSPTLIWIDKRCYRVNQSLDMSNTRVFNEPKGYVEEDLYAEEEEVSPVDYIIEMTDDNRFKTEFHVPNVFYGCCIGAKGSTRKRIEMETKTQIKIPAIGETEPYIKILGRTKENVISARRWIETIVLQARKKQSFTHFIGIPLNSSEVQHSFNKFQKEILDGSAVYGLLPNMFQTPIKIHVTIGMLSLMDKVDRENCTKLLQDTDELIIKPLFAKYGNEINLKIAGLNIMNDDPSSVNVLYAKIESEALQELADEITKYFVSKGYMYSRNEHVKLHVTLINTRYIEEDDESNPIDYKKRSQIKRDARDILEKFKDFNFGTIKLREIHLSQLKTSTPEKYYEATSIIHI